MSGINQVKNTNYPLKICNNANKVHWLLYRQKEASSLLVNF